MRPCKCPLVVWTKLPVRFWLSSIVPDLFVLDAHTHTHTLNTSLLPAPLAPISQICSGNIIIFLFLINHRDSEGPRYT